MITSATTTLFEIMITNKQINKQIYCKDDFIWNNDNKQTNKQIYCKDECYLYCNDEYDHKCKDDFIWNNDNKQTNKQTKKQIYCEDECYFIVMTTMITSAKTTLFEIMITNKQINK